MDIYSLACCIIDILYKNRLYKKPLLSQDGKRLILVPHDANWKYDITFDDGSDATDYCDSLLGNHGGDLIKLMATSNSSKRASGAKLLAHKYFKDIEIQHGGDTKCVINSSINAYILYSGEEIHARSYELEYLEQIHNTYKHDLFMVKCSDTCAPRLNVLNNWLFNVGDEYKSCYEGLINTYGGTYIISKYCDTARSKIQLIGIALKYLNEEISYAGSYMTIKECAYISDDTFSVDKIRSTIVELLPFITLKPIIIHIEYIIIHLAMNNEHLTLTNIRDIETYTVIVFTLFCGTNVGTKNKSVTFLISDLVMYSVMCAFRKLKLKLHSFIKLDDSVYKHIHATFKAKLLLLGSQPVAQVDNFIELLKLLD